LNKETLGRQFAIVKKETNRSHVMHYGDMKIAQDHVAEYIGNKTFPLKKLFGDSRTEESRSTVAWPSREIHLRMLEKELHEAQKESERKALRHKIKKLEMKREYLEAFMESLVWAIAPQKSQYEIMHTMPSSVSSLHCFDDVIKAFHRSCFHFGHNPYALKYSYVFANLCAAGTGSETIIRKMFDKCVDIEIQGIH
uniref:RdRp n=1 Tax=Gongylonema pulchrum TaxID=637853 RepID=A0A183D6Y0_9BILA